HFVQPRPRQQKCLRQSQSRSARDGLLLTPSRQSAVTAVSRCCHVRSPSDLSQVTVRSFCEIALGVERPWRFALAHPSPTMSPLGDLRRIASDDFAEIISPSQLQIFPATPRAPDYRSLRVALFTGNYNMIRDGVSLILNRLVSFLEAQGVEVLVLSPTIDRPAFAPQGTLLSVPSIPVPLRPEYRITLGLPAACLKRLDAFRPTLFHLSTPDMLGYAARRLGKRWKLPIVATFHTRFDTYLRYYRLGWLEPLVTRYL